MKYKVGDKVRIKSLDWYHHNKDSFGSVTIADKKPKFTYAMSKYCGMVLTIDDHTEYDSEYYMIEDDGVYVWSNEMIEGLVEEESANYSKVIDNGVSNPIIAKTSSATIDTDKGFYSYSDSDDNLEMEWNLPEGYQFVAENGNVINTKKIVLEKKKKEYPKTYEECYKIMGVKLSDCYIQGYKSPLLEDLQELLICRNAYCKLYGEEMGLGKPWEPNWEDNTPKFSIRVVENMLSNITQTSVSYVLTFPTEEMRDAFYENFKVEIEICKELL